MATTLEPHARAALLQDLAQEYHDLNGSYLEILEEPPSALEFSRLVHISRPVKIKGFRVPALTLWSNEYLIERMGPRKMSIATTPNGRADAVTRGLDDRLYFAEPLVQKMTMAELIPNVSADQHSSGAEIHYLQSQNGNLYSSDFFQGGDSSSEFEPLRQDVPSEIPWCSNALDSRPDAVNLWMGDSRSVTSIHSDPYENIYTVVRGKKHFTLLPPVEGWCLKERIYPHATYTRASSTSVLTLTPSPSVPSVRWSSVLDPDMPGVLPPEAHPIQVILHPGETLYLPAGWWHHVRQSEDITIALNWWYDVEMRGMSWVLLNFLRSDGKVPPGNSIEAEDREKDQHDA